MKKHLLNSLCLFSVLCFITEIALAQQSANQKLANKIMLSAGLDKNVTVPNELAATAPANDLCANAITINCGDTKTGTTVGSGYDFAPDCGAGADDPAGGVWYKHVGTGVNITFSMCNASTTYDSQIRAFTGSCGSFVCETGGDDECGSNGFQSAVTFFAANGVTYYLLVHGYTGVYNATGSFALTATCSVGINESNYDSANMNVYPNPFSGSATVSLENGKEISTISIFSIDGRLVSKTDGLSGHTVEVQRNGLAPGIYFIEAGLNDGTSARKRIVIQ